MDDERRTDEHLSELLHDAVAGVEPGDRLGDIRDRAGAAGRRRRGWYAGGVAALVAASVAIVVVAGTTGSEPSSGPGPAASSPTAPEDVLGQPVYYVGDAAGRPRLFRSFEIPREPTRGLATEIALLQDTPSDPDYRTLWPAGSLGPALEDGTEVVRVTLLDPQLRDRPGGMSSREAELALQQVVHTMRAALQAPVLIEFTVAGERTDRVLGVDTSDPVGVEPQLEVLALVNISDPVEGATVSGSFTARGRASSFEATVPWQLREADGSIVKKGFAVSDGWLDRLYPWQTEVDVSDVAPGTYTFAAMTDDPTAGTEGPGPTTDTRTVVVE